MKEEIIYVDKIHYSGGLNNAIKKVKANRKKIYLKKFLSLSQFSVWMVNGEFIRKNICEDFVNLAQHYHFKFVPKNEFWIDCKKSEAHFLVDYLLIENRLMQKKVSFREASKIANFAEKRERARSSFARKLKLLFKRKELLKKVHKKIWRNYKDKLFVYIVDGEAVRDFFDVSFVGGAHHYADNFIPKNEVWIDDSIHQSEIKFLLIHELHERNLMKSKNLSYLPAHKSATIVEDYCRKHPKKIDKLLEKEFRLS